MSQLTALIDYSPLKLSLVATINKFSGASPGRRRQNELPRRESNRPQIGHDWIKMINRRCHLPDLNSPGRLPACLVTLFPTSLPPAFYVLTPLWVCQSNLLSASSTTTRRRRVTFEGAGKLHRKNRKWSVELSQGHRHHQKKENHGTSRLCSTSTWLSPLLVGWWQEKKCPKLISFSSWTSDATPPWTKIEG